MRDLWGLHRLQHAAPHLGGGLDGEGDGDDLLGLLDHREKLEIAAHEKLGLARARGGLDDERARGIERGVAGGLVGDWCRAIHGMRRDYCPQKSGKLSGRARQREHLSLVLELGRTA
jgi:hypothetical protein